MNCQEVRIINARIVTADRVIDGALLARDGRIAEIVEDGHPVSGSLQTNIVDFDGDYLIPGLVELHTDNLERQFQPRPNVRWPADAAMLAHDSQMISAGITTVFDAVIVGFYGGDKARVELLKRSLESLAHAEIAGALKADHYLHLRCELSDPHCLDMFEPLVDEPHLKLVSLMDHTPGQRQWQNIEKYRTFHRGRTGASEAEFQALIARRVDEQARYVDPHRDGILDRIRGRGIAIASHDDTTDEHVDESHAHGVSISEFPTTLNAAAAAHKHGMTTIMGGPNVIMGGSHSGNASAVDLAKEGLLDGLSSDYVPVSLLHAAFRLADILDWGLPASIRLVSLNNAAMVGLTDRGEIKIGKRADLLRVRRALDMPTIRGVWRQGERIA